MICTNYSTRRTDKSIYIEGDANKINKFPKSSETSSETDITVAD